jgi:hypothetical protein
VNVTEDDPHGFCPDCVKCKDGGIDECNCECLNCMDTKIALGIVPATTPISRGGWGSQTAPTDKSIDKTTTADQPVDEGYSVQVDSTVPADNQELCEPTLMKQSQSAQMNLADPRGAVEPITCTESSEGDEFLTYCHSLQGVQGLINEFIIDFNEQGDGTTETYYGNLLTHLYPHVTSDQYQYTEHNGLSLRLKDICISDIPSDNPNQLHVWKEVLQQWMIQAGLELKKQEPEIIKASPTAKLPKDINQLIYVNSKDNPNPGWKTPMQYAHEVRKGSSKSNNQLEPLFTKVLTKSDFFRLIKLTLETRVTLDKDFPTSEDDDHTESIMDKESRCKAQTDGDPDHLKKRKLDGLDSKRRS